ncbi:hypothetical protein B0H14DRAFT_3665954 [Mycena olivaceomarginata]|nr:hypothetical protein B0H14DRAFT_3665954 [Mycena olivaceomarginata]
MQGQGYMQQAPVVYGTPTESFSVELRAGDEIFVKEGDRVIDFLFFLLLLLSTGLRRHALDLVDLGLPAQLSQLDVQLPRARAYERRDGDAADSPRAAYPGASGVAGVVVGVIRIRARQRLAAPMHHPYRALRKRAGMNKYRQSELEYREECESELVAEKEEAAGEGGACEASDEQGHSDESGEGGGESGAQVNASGAEVDADARCSYCTGRVQVLHGLFALQGRVTRRCAEAAISHSAVSRRPTYSYSRHPAMTLAIKAVDRMREREPSV